MSNHEGAPAPSDPGEAEGWSAPRESPTPELAQPATRAEHAASWARALSDPAGGQTEHDAITGYQHGTPDPAELLEQIAPDVAERDDAEPPAAEQPSALSGDDLVDFFLGPEELTPEEAAEREAVRVEHALRSGQVVQTIADAEAAEIDALSQLKDRKPGMASEEAMDAMDPLWDQVEEHFPGIRSNPELTAAVIDQIYEAVGGEERFGPPPPEAQQWLDALGVGQEKPTDIIG